MDPRELKDPHLQVLLQRNPAALRDIADVYQRAAASPLGEQLIRDLYEACGWRSPLPVTPVGGGPIDPLMTHYLLGRRSIALRVDDLLQIDTSLIVEREDRAAQAARAFAQPEDER